MPDEFGDRMKLYEGVESERRLMPLIPAIARLDGKCFTKFTEGLQRPFDPRFSDLMVATMVFLVKKTNASCGYTQSDEITLGWYSWDYKSEFWFDGRIQKINSVLSAMTSVFFNRKLASFVPEKEEAITDGEGPVFDCRVWNVPTVEEGANAFLWREQDATKNSISMATRHYYSPKEMHLKSGAEMQEMLWKKGVNWNDYPASFKRGVYLQRKKIVSRFTEDEIEALPPQHNARTNPDLVVERTEYRRLDLPKMTTVVNRASVIFFGAEPEITTPSPM